MSSLKREMITLFNLKSMWIISAIVIIFCGLFMYQNYSNAQANVDLLLEDYDTTQIENYDDEYIQQLKEEITEIYVTFHCKNFIDNSYGILIGIGMLLFPIIGIIYIADDYNKGTIKNKIVYDGLTKVAFSKLAAIFIYLVSFMLLYYFLQLLETRILYNHYLHNLDLKGIISQNDISVKDRNGIGVLIITLLIILFYVSLCMLMTFIFKNMVMGFAMLIISNYVVLPIKYTPHNIFNWLINKVFRITEYSPFNFANNINFENVCVPLCVLGVYFAVILTMFYVASKIQRN